MFKRLWKAGEFAGVLALAGFGLLACAGPEKTDVPVIEGYFQPAGDLVAAGIGRSSEGDQKQGPAGEKARTGPLTLERCVRIALDKNPLNRAAREGIAVSKEAVGEARAAYYPEVGALTGYGRWQRHAFLPTGLIRPGIPSTIGPTDDWSAALEARFTLFDSGRRRAQLLAGMSDQRVMEEDASRIRLDIVLEVHKAFYGLMAAKETLSVAEKTLARAQDHFRLAESRRAVGAVTKADVLRARVEVADANLALVRSDNMVRIARGNLNTAMGLPVATNLEIEEPAREIVSPSGLDLSQAMDLAVRTRPVIKQALHRIAAAGYGVNEAKSAFGPTIRAEGGYGRRDDDFLPDDEEWLVGVAMELPLFTGFSRKHRLERKKAGLRKEEAEIERLIRTVQQEVWTAFWKLDEAYQAVKASEALVGDAEESMRATRARYAVGADTITDLLDAQTALARAEAVRIETQWDYRIAEAVYARSAGIGKTP